jgi:glutathione peroxidase
MKIFFAALLLGASALTPALEAAEKTPPTLDYTMKSLSGKQVDLSKYLGKVVMIVNTASKCGLTPQYEGLQDLHEKYAGRGLAILGFPCNQFGGQSPGTSRDISEFCAKNYGVTFDMFAKIEVNGPGACPLYKYLTSKETNPKFAGSIKWNFNKFLLDREGNVIARFEPRVRPDSPEVIGAVENALARK